MSIPLLETDLPVRPLVRLALPVLAEQFLLMLVGLSDTMITGHYLEPVHLAAMSQMAYVLWLLGNVFVAVDVGATALVARMIGSGDREAARHVTNQAFVLGMLLALGVTALIWALGGPLVAVMGLAPDASAMAERYISFLLPMLPALMLQSVGNACLRGAGDTLSGMMAMTAMNITNVCVSWGLVSGWGPWPRLGWDGLAIGTAAGYLVGGAWMLCALVAGRAGLGLQWRLLVPHPDWLRRILRIGVPGALDVLILIVCQFWFKRIVNDLGSLAAAAHGVAISIESLAYLPGGAFQVAATTLTGQYLGAGLQRQATRGAVLSCLAAAGLMSLAGLLFFLWPQPLIGLVLDPRHADTSRQAAELLRIVACAMPALAVTMVLSGALRGAGDTRWPLAFGLVGMLAVRVPLAWLLTRVVPWGVEGAWYAMVADLHVRAILLGVRFWQGGWKRVRI